jgi:hypothetical protein
MCVCVCVCVCVVHVVLYHMKVTLQQLHMCECYAMCG